MKNISFYIFFLLPVVCWAQQDITFSLYSFNSAILNPAHAGTFDQTEVYALGRLQWVGVEGAPRSYSVTANIPFSAKAGLSAGVLLDEVGPTQRRVGYMDFGSNVKLTNKLHLSFGLRGKVTSYNVGLTRLSTTEAGDISYLQNINQAAIFNVGAGMTIYSDRFYAGFSSPTIMERSFSNINADVVLEQRHFFGYMGYRFKIAERLEFNPSVLVKQTENAPLDLDLNFMLVFDKKIAVSGMFSHRDGVGVNLFYDISKRVRLAIAMEYPTTELRIANAPTYEFGARYLLGNKRERAISPVYFNY